MHLPMRMGVRVPSPALIKNSMDTLGITQEYVEAYAIATQSEWARQDAEPWSHDTIGTVCGLIAMAAFVVVAALMRHKKNKEAE